MTKLSIAQAAREWGMSRRTLQRRVADGTVSVTAGTGNAKAVDTSEMQRVFGEPSATSAQDSPRATPDKSQVESLLLDQVKYLREQIEKKDDQIAELNSQLANIRRPILPRLLPWMKE